MNLQRRRAERLFLRIPCQALIAAALTATYMASVLAAHQPEPLCEGGVTKLDRRAHDHALVLDTHLDTPTHFGRQGWRITNRHRFDIDFSPVDQPRMVAGGLDGGFFVIFTEQGPLTPVGYQNARDSALVRQVQIREMVERHRDELELAFTADDARRIARSGRRIVFQSMENAYPLGSDPGLLRAFYSLGVRLLGPVHSATNQFDDSSTDEPRWSGLSPLGRDLVTEANRLGVVLDASHASDQVLDQLIDLSKTPIVLPHSGLKAICNHPRSIDDEHLKKLAASGGVIQLAAVD